MVVDYIYLLMYNVAKVEHGIVDKSLRLFFKNK